MSWTVEANLGPLSFTVTAGDSDHVDSGGAVAGEAWLVDSLRVGWRLPDLPPAKPEPVTMSLTVACHPPTLLRELDEGQPADVRFIIAGDGGGDHAVYAAGRIGGPLTVTTVERGGIQWGVARLELVDYTVDLATATLTVGDIPAQSWYDRIDQLNAELLADTGVGLVDYSATIGGPVLTHRYGLIHAGASFPYFWHAPITKGNYPAAQLLDQLLDSTIGYARPGPRLIFQTGDALDPGVAFGSLPVVVPVVERVAGAPGELAGYVLTAAHKVSHPAYLPAMFGLTPDGYGLVLNTDPDGTRHLPAGEVQVAGGWTRDRVSTRVTASHSGAGSPAVVTAYDPTAGDARIVSRDLSTDLTDDGGADAAEDAEQVAWSRLPTPVYDRLGWRLGSFTWHPLASSPTAAGNVLRQAIPDHSDISAFSASDALSQPWWITGVAPELAFSERTDYAGTLDAADFTLAPGQLPGDYALTFSLVRRIAQPAFHTPAPAVLNSDALDAAGLGAVDALDLDPSLTFSDLMLARSPV